MNVQGVPQKIAETKRVLLFSTTQIWILLLMLVYQRPGNFVSAESERMRHDVRSLATEEKVYLTECFFFKVHGNVYGGFCTKYGAYRVASENTLKRLAFNYVASPYILLCTLHEIFVQFQRVKIILHFFSEVIEHFPECDTLQDCRHDLPDPFCDQSWRGWTVFSWKFVRFHSKSCSSTRNVSSLCRIRENFLNLYPYKITWPISC